MDLKQIKHELVKERAQFAANIERLDRVIAGLGEIDSVEPGVLTPDDAKRFRAMTVKAAVTHLLTQGPPQTAPQIRTSLSKAGKRVGYGTIYNMLKKNPKVFTADDDHRWGLVTS